MMSNGITELQSSFWFADALLGQAPCILYVHVLCNVQISRTSLVFVSECNTQSHMVGFLLLQGARQQQLNRASCWSFERYHPTSKNVSVCH